MASEQGYDTPPRCANGCGFFGRRETQNLCSKCYRELGLAEVKKHAHAAPPKLDVEKVSAASSVQGLNNKEGTNSNAKSKDRCPCCNRRVGLAKGFKCRCGNIYCSAHRYPEEHQCTFDFKAVGRDLLAKVNPIVQAADLTRPVSLGCIIVNLNFLIGESSKELSMPGK